MFLILVCEPCAENGHMKAGVYRDEIGQVLCEACDDARRVDRQMLPGDYGRQVETGPRVYKRDRVWKGAA